MLSDKQRLQIAVAVGEWQTAIDQAMTTLDFPEELVETLLDEQHMMLALILSEGYLFYPGHTDLAEGPTLARRYVTEHQAELEVSNQE